jgi:hypothetical protein
MNDRGSKSFRGAELPGMPPANLFAIERVLRVALELVGMLLKASVTDMESTHAAMMKERKEVMMLMCD